MTIRKREIFENMEKAANVTGIDMATNTLKQEIDDYLEHPVLQDTEATSFKFLALVVATFDFPNLYYVRLRCFSVQDACVDAGTTWVCHCAAGLHDVTVHTFSSSCTILGKHSDDEHWKQEGHRLSWHTALQAQLVLEVETSLTEHGMKVGCGLSSEGDFHQAWVSLEAWKQPQRYLEAAKVAKAELEARTVTLLGLCMSNFADNTSLNVGGRTALWYASGRYIALFSKSGMAKLLVDYGTVPTVAGGKSTLATGAESYSGADPDENHNFCAELMKSWEVQQVRRLRRGK